MRITPTKNVLLNTIVKNASSTPTNWYVSSNGVLLASGTFSTHTGTISGGLLLQAGETYVIEVDAGGATYTSRTQSTYQNTYFMSTNGLICFLEGLSDGTAYNYFTNIDSFSITEYPLENRMAIDSALVLPTFMAKTNALYTHKVSPIPMFAKSITALGANVALDIGSIVKSFTGLTKSLDYYIGNTYGGVSTTVGRVSAYIGKSISATAILSITDYSIKTDMVMISRTELVASGVVTYSHGLGRVPEKIDFYMTSKVSINSEVRNRSS